MKLDRSTNAKRNILYGLINKIITLFLPFILRTIMIYTIGIEYAGLNGLFSSILQVLNMSELGFGSAVVYSMYKSIAHNDVDQVNALLNFYKKVYRIIGIIVLCIGLLLVPFLPNLISGGYPTDINIYVLYLIYLANTCLSYFLFAYKTSLLNAYQRTDIISNVHTITQGLLYLTQIILLLTVKNYYYYVLVMPIFTVLNNLINSRKVDKLFPQYRCKGTVNKETITDMKYKVSGLMINKLCLTTRNTFDSLFISAFMGLTETAIYGNYYYIINAIITFISVISNAMIAGVGNSIQIETIDKNYEDFKKFNFLYMWISGWCTICLLCLIQPFMKLWMGEKNMFSFGVVILLSIYFYVLKMGDIRGLYSDAAGLWWENRHRAVIEAILNLLLNFLLVQFWGIYGIIIATLISLFFINFIGGSQIVFRYYFKNGKFSEYMILHGKYALITFIIAWITLKCCSFVRIDGFIGLCIKAVICIVLPNVIYFLIYCSRKEYKGYVGWLISKFKKKL